MRINLNANQAGLAAGLLVTFLSSAAEAATGVVPVTMESWSVGMAIPDFDPVGIADTRVISGSGIGHITDLTVTLRISGGWSGDLYATVVHDTGFSVLLNRVGRTSSNLLGDGATALNVMLRDGASTDIHAISSGFAPVAGAFQPDGRDVSPLSVFDTTPRTATLGAFDGLPADGSWTLFIADVSGSDQSTLEEWGLEITGLVPEPSAMILLSTGVLAFLVRRDRRS